MTTLNLLFQNLSLKEMDGSLLSHAITAASRTLGADPAQLLDLEEALAFASYLHRNDVRANRGKLPRDTYITHPYRNTLRLLRYGNKLEDFDVVLASILHDTVEDHPFEIVNDLMGVDIEVTEQEARDMSYGFYTDVFSPRVAAIVTSMSNPLPTPGVTLTKAEKRAGYVEHLELVLDHPDVFKTKSVDFVDNAVGLYHNTGNPGMVKHLATKYSLAIPSFTTRLENTSFVQSLNLPDWGVDMLRTHINAGKIRLDDLMNDN